MRDRPVSPASDLFPGSALLGTHVSLMGVDSASSGGLESDPQICPIGRRQVLSWGQCPHDHPGPCLCLLAPGLPAALQLLSRVPLFETPWTAARRASLSITIS